MDNIVKIIEIIAWPFTAFFILLLTKNEWKRIILALTNRIASDNTDIIIGKKGLQISRVIENAEAKLESQAIDIEQIQSIIIEQLKLNNAYSAINEDDNSKITQALNRLADDYLSIENNRWEERVQAKDSAAINMAKYILQHGISKEYLAQSNHEGILLSLAATIQAFPEKQDVFLILKSCSKVTRLHVKYRIAIAISKLAERNLIPFELFNKVLYLLNTYTNGADAYLLKRLQASTNTVKSSRQKLVNLNN